MFKPKKQYKLHKRKDAVMLEVRAVYDTGRYGWARLTIKGGKFFVNQSDEPLNPVIDLEEIRKLIAEYDALCPSEPA